MIKRIYYWGLLFAGMHAITLVAAQPTDGSSLAAQSKECSLSLAALIARCHDDESRILHSYLMAGQRGDKAAFSAFAYYFVQKMKANWDMPEFAARFTNHALNGYWLALCAGDTSCACSLITLCDDLKISCSIDQNLYKAALLVHKQDLEAARGAALSSSPAVMPLLDYHSLRDLNKLLQKLELVMPKEPEAVASVLNRTIAAVDIDDKNSRNMFERASKKDPQALVALAADTLLWRIPQQSAIMVDAYINAWQYASDELGATIKKQLQVVAARQGSTMIGDLWLRALEIGNQPLGKMLIECMGSRNWQIYPELAQYLVLQERVRFGLLVYQQKNPLALELLMRILEMSDQRRYHLPLAAWCKEYQLDEQPQCDSKESKFEHYSPTWYHVQNLRSTTYVDAYLQGIDVKDRLIRFAHTVGGDCFDREDYCAAVPFLHPAVQLQDAQARELFTAICLSNPQYIVPEQGWMKPAVQRCIKEKGAHAQVVLLNLLMGLGAAEREQAFQLFLSLLADQKEACYAARYCSKLLAGHIEQLAEQGDVPAIKLFALRSMLLGTHIQKAYSLMQSIADCSNPSITYLYTALAERITDLPDRERSVLLSYHNVARSSDPAIRQQAIKNLGQYAGLGCPLAKDLLLLAENTMGDIPAFLNAVAPLSSDTIRINFIDWYLETIQEEQVKNLSGASSFKVLLCGTAYDRDLAFVTLLRLVENNSAMISMEMLPPAVGAHLMRLSDQNDLPALLIRALIAIVSEKYEDIPQAVMSFPHYDNPWIIFIQSAKAEYDATRDAAITSHVAGYNTLLSSGIPYLEKQAEDGLMRCIKKNDVAAQALLFCHCCERYQDRRKAIAAVAASAVAKPFYQYLNQHCFDRLVKASEHNAFAAFVLGKVYEQKIAELKDDESLRLQYMQLAVDAYLKAEQGGHPCAVMINPLAIYLAVSYRAARNDQQAEQIENKLYHYSNADEIEKGLKAWLGSKRAKPEHVGYIMNHLERLAQKNVKLAVELAHWFCEGKQWTNGVELKVDKERALRCATLAAKQNSQEGQILKATLILKHTSASAQEVDKALRFLQIQKNLDPETQALVAQVREQEDKKERELEYEQCSHEIELLAHAQDGDRSVTDLVKRLEKRALQGDDRAAKAVGLRLMKIDDNAKNIQEVSQQACPLFERYLAAHPEDVTTYPSYLRALYYRHRAGDDRKAYQLLKQLPSTADLSSETGGIIAFKNNDYERAFDLLNLMNMSLRARWYKALAIFKMPSKRDCNRSAFFEALQAALPLAANGLEGKESLEDGEELVQWLCSVDDPRSYSVLARLSLIMKNNRTLQAYLKQHKNDFGMRLVSAMEQDVAACAVGLYALRHQLWGLHQDSALMQTIVNCCSSIIGKWPRIPMQGEIEAQCLLLAEQFNAHNISPETANRVAVDIWASISIYSMMILDNKSEALERLIDFEEELLACASRESFLLNFQSTFPVDELLKQYTDDGNEIALYALLISLSHGLLSDEQLFVLVPHVQRFTLDIFNKALKPDVRLCSAVAKICVVFGNYLGEQGVPFSEYKKCYQYALSLDPLNRDAQRELAVKLINMGSTAAEVQRGLQMLEQLARIAPTAEICNFLGFLFINGGSSHVVLPDQAKAEYYLKQAASLHSAVAKDMLEGMKLLEQQPVIMTPLNKDYEGSIAKIAALRSRAHEYYDGRMYDQALAGFNWLIKNYLDANSALSAAVIYIENKHDYARGGIALMQVLACMKFHGLTDQFFINGINNLQEELWDLGKRGQQLAIMWASAVEQTKSDYPELFRKKLA